MEYLRAKELLDEHIGHYDPDRYFNPVVNNDDIIEKPILQFWTKFIQDWGNRYHIISFNIRQLEESIATNYRKPKLDKPVQQLIRSKILEPVVEFMKPKRSLLGSLVTSILCGDSSSPQIGIDYVFKNVLRTTGETICLAAQSKAISSVDLILSDEEILKDYHISSIPILAKYLTDNNLAQRLQFGGFYIKSTSLSPLSSNQVNTILSIKKAIAQMENYANDLSDIANEKEKERKDISAITHRREICLRLTDTSLRKLDKYKYSDLNDSIISELSSEALTLQEFLNRRNDSTKGDYVEVKYGGSSVNDTPVSKSPHTTSSVQHSNQNSISYPDVDVTPVMETPRMAGRFAQQPPPSQPTGKAVMSSLFLGGNDQPKQEEIHSSNFYGKMPKRSILF